MESFASLLLDKVTQLSMYCPNVNWKPFHDFQQHLRSPFQVHCLDVGLCTTHTKQGCKLQSGMLSAFYLACTRCSTMHQPTEKILSRIQNAECSPFRLFRTVGWRMCLSLRGPFHYGSTWKSTLKPREIASCPCLKAGRTKLSVHS